LEFASANGRGRAAEAKKDGAVMGLGREQEVEIFKQPVFMPGEKVQAKKYVRNDGTFPGRDVGDILVKKGEIGYVRNIGTFLQQFYIYSVEFVDQGIIVGMRARELISLDAPSPSEGKPA
jgi:nitrogen fixation protein NifZ